MHQAQRVLAAQGHDYTPFGKFYWPNRTIGLGNKDWNCALRTDRLAAHRGLPRAIISFKGCIVMQDEFVNRLGMFQTAQGTLNDPANQTVLSGQPPVIFTTKWPRRRRP